ncbi:MAG TPA: glycosyltransferase family 2 protein [Patescibacteria group bacterium]|nr:glycosyltransferase family 2 protein [Patescibacteria group bacterium]
MKLPSISVVIATYQSENTIDKCLNSIRMQRYPQKSLEIIICDGESSDSTRTIAKKHGVTLVTIPKDRQNAEYNKAVGVAKATRDLILLIDHDNVLPHRDWLRRMIEPLQKHHEVVGVETLRYHYDPNNSLLDRYFALFGAGDPLAYYLGKADRLSYMDTERSLYRDAIEYPHYYLVSFNPDTVPTLGANGFLIRRNLLMRQAEASPGKFFHIDVNVDLIRKGYTTYAFVKDTIIHLTGYKNISQFLYRRKLFMQQYYINTNAARRYSVYTSRDAKRLLMFILYSTTMVKPLYDAIRGFRKIPDPAWFLHPYLCFVLTMIYGSVIIQTKSAFYAKKLLQK